MKTSVKVLSLIMAIVMLITAVPMLGGAVSPETAYKEMLLEGLADPTFTKTTENYDGYHFVKGTKAVWDCKLYTLTATATKVSGSIVTFELGFTSKIPEPYTTVNGGWYGYHIIANTNEGSKEFSPDQKMEITVNTAKRDPFGTSAAAGGTQFIEIRVEKTVKEDWFPVYKSQTSYYDAIVQNRDEYPENAGYFSYVDLCDTYALSYYTKPTYKINTNSIKVTQTAIALGIYGFDATVQYRVKGASKWTKKNFAKGSKITLSKLKANTIYQIQVLCKLPYTDLETGQKKYVMDLVGSTLTLTTAINSKPSLAKVTISKVKYGKKTVKGYWESDGDWHPAETFYTCSYTMTVKLRNVPKNAKGLYWKAGGAAYYQKGRKSTYTFKLNYKAKKPLKGKKLSCNLYYSSNTIGYSAVGFSPARAVSYKLKNSSTNYKK